MAGCINWFQLSENGDYPQYFAELPRKTMIGPGSDKHDILVILLSLPSNIVFFLKQILAVEKVSHILVK